MSRRSDAARSAGLLGGRPRKVRTVPPAEQAIPAARMGPPTKCTPELIVKFAAAYARCGRVEDAAAACGIHVATLRNWLKSAEAGREPYRSMLAKAKEQESIAVIEVMDWLRSHAEVRARVAWLDRVRPVRQAVDVDVSATPATLALLRRVSTMRDDEVDALLASGELDGDPEEEP